MHKKPQKQGSFQCCEWAQQYRHHEEQICLSAKLIQWRCKTGAPTALTLARNKPGNVPFHLPAKGTGWTVFLFSLKIYSVGKFDDFLCVSYFYLIHKTEVKIEIYCLSTFLWKHKGCSRSQPYSLRNKGHCWSIYTLLLLCYYYQTSAHCSLCDFWACPVQGQELNSMFLCSPFWLRIFYCSMVLWRFREWFNNL